MTSIGDSQLHLAALQLALRPLRVNSFSIFCVGFLVSSLGSSMTAIVLSFAILRNGGSTDDVGFVLASTTGPSILFSLIGGIAGDVLSRRTVMFVADVFRMVIQSLVAILFALHYAHVLLLCVLGALLGLGNALYSPCRPGLITEILPPSEYQAANSLCAFIKSVSQVLGPTVGGAAVVLVGPQLTIGIDASSYFVSAICMVSTGVSFATQDRSRSGESSLQMLMSGWREFARRRWIWAISTQFAVFHLFVIGPVVILGAAMFKQGAGPAIWATLVSLVGLGAVLGAVVGIRLRLGRPAVWTLVASGTYFLVPLSLVWNVPFVVRGMCFLAGGFGFSLSNVIWETTLQSFIPETFLSRVVAFDEFGSMSLLPLSYILAGPLSSIFGRPGTLLLGASITVLGPATVILLRDVRQLGGSNVASNP